MFKYLILLPLILSLSETNVASQSFNVPKGGHVMVDGQCDSSEWNDAAKMPAAENYRLLFKKNQDFVYVCIDSPTTSGFMMDLYFSPDAKRMFTFHASAKLGERMLENGKWKEFTTDWDWWNVNGWIANTARFNSFGQQRFLPNKAIEFQISRKHFSGRHWRVMFDFLGLEKPLVFPLNSDKLVSKTWLTLKL